MIRVASACDIPEMQRVRESVRENTLPDYSVLSTDRYRAHLEELGRGWVYEREGRVVGIAVADLEEVGRARLDPARETVGPARAHLFESLVGTLPVDRKAPRPGLLPLVDLQDELAVAGSLPCPP